MSGDIERTHDDLIMGSMRSKSGGGTAEGTCLDTGPGSVALHRTFLVGLRGLSCLSVGSNSGGGIAGICLETGPGNVGLDLTFCRGVTTGGALCERSVNKIGRYTEGTLDGLGT